VHQTIAYVEPKRFQDGKRVISASTDGTLKIWASKAGTKFPHSPPTLASGDAEQIMAGAALGRLHFLKIEGV
jgi:hypothetical protein